MALVERPQEPPEIGILLLTAATTKDQLETCCPHQTSPQEPGARPLSSPLARQPLLMYVYPILGQEHWGIGCCSESPAKSRRPTPQGSQKPWRKKSHHLACLHLPSASWRMEPLSLLTPSSLHFVVPCPFHTHTPSDPCWPQALCLKTSPLQVLCSSFCLPPTLLSFFFFLSAKLCRLGCPSHRGRSTRTRATSILLHLQAPVLCPLGWLNWASSPDSRNYAYRSCSHHDFLCLKRGTQVCAESLCPGVRKFDLWTHLYHLENMGKSLSLSGLPELGHRAIKWRGETKGLHWDSEVGEQHSWGVTQSQTGRSKELHGGGPNQELAGLVWGW